MHKKHIFLRVFSRITIFACVFCVFFASPVFATLPAGYTELEYIESTGTQWIKTGIKPTINDTLECDFEYTDITAYGNVLTSQSGGTNHRILRLENATNNLQWTAQSYETIVQTISLNTKYNFKWHYETGNSWIDIDGVRKGTATSETTSLNVPYGLFSNGTDTYRSKGKCYHAKVQTLDSTMNLIPARRNSDNEVGMYDTVSNTFFTNQGTGDFIAGPVAGIKIATTKMVDEEFAQAEANLAATVQTIESVVSRTITQTGQIQVLQDTKQTRPDETCPANMKCLLVQDEDGTPHWYPIIEP